MLKSPILELVREHKTLNESWIEISDWTWGT